MGKRFTPPHWWHEQPPWWAYVLWPFSVIYGWISRIRYALFRSKVIRVARLPIPLIVVGNLTAGGNGKTPVVLALALALKARGYRPGIVSRGFGGHYQQRFCWVKPDSDPYWVGDEPVWLAREAGVPVVVAKRRYWAALALLQSGQCDILLSDDGLQHLSLWRDIEIVLLDSHTKNPHFLPLGPWRESSTRLEDADCCLSLGSVADATHFAWEGLCCVNLLSGEERSLNSFSDDEPVHALAGVAKPQRFFDMLSQLGVSYIPHIFPDHHGFVPQDIPAAGICIVTEKDAVKLQFFQNPRIWALKARVQLSEAFLKRLEEKLGKLICNV